MTETLQFANGSTIEVETEDEEIKGRLESIDISSDFEDEIDTVYYGTSRNKSVSTGYYQSEHRELKIDELEEGNTTSFLDEGTLMVNIHE